MKEEVITGPPVDRNQVHRTLRLFGKIIGIAALIAGNIKMYADFHVGWSALEDPWAMMWFGLLMFALSHEDKR